MNSSTSAIIKDVLYSSKLRESLMSIAVINDNRYDILFKSNILVWIKNSDDYIVAKGQREGNLFYIDVKLKQMNTITDYIFKVDATDLSSYMLWHLQIGYLGFKNLDRKSV